MHLIIDGYNLLGFAGLMGPKSVDAEQAREQLLRDLAAYRLRKGHVITLVFDAWRQGLASERHEHRSGVEVIYSRRGEKADAVIQRLAEEYGPACAVVSSDREVAGHARAHGAFIMSAGEFAAGLRAGSEGDRTAPGTWGKDSGREDEPDRPRSPEKKGNPRKLPKRLRQRRQQLKRF